MSGYLGRPLMDLDWIWYDHGPFESEIYAQLSYLQGQGYLKEERVEFANGKASCRYEATDKTLPLPRGDEEQAIVDFIVAEYGRMELGTLLEEVVYQTRPMVDAKKREAFQRRLRMDLVNEEAIRAGEDVQTIMVVVKDLDAGQGTPLEEVLAELGLQEAE